METLVGLVFIVIVVAGTIWLVGFLWPVVGPLIGVLLVLTAIWVAFLVGAKVFGIALEIVAATAHRLRRGWQRVRGRPNELP